MKRKNHDKNFFTFDEDGIGGYKIQLQENYYTNNAGNIILNTSFDDLKNDYNYYEYNDITDNLIFKLVPK